MKAEINHDFLEVTLTVPECVRLARHGERVGDRIHPLYSDANIYVWPLDQYGGPDQDKVRALGETAAQVLTNEDLNLFVPAAWPGDVRYRGAFVPKEYMYSFAGPDYLEHYKRQLPEKGVHLIFEGSLEIIDLSAVGYTATDHSY